MWSYESLVFLGEYADQKLINKSYKCHFKFTDSSMFEFFINKNVNIPEGVYNLQIGRTDKYLFKKFIKLCNSENLTKSTFEKIIEKCVLINDLESFKYIILIDKFKCNFENIIKLDMSRNNNKSILPEITKYILGESKNNFLFDNFLNIYEKDISIIDDYHNLVLYLIDKSTNIPDSILEIYASYGDYDIVKLLIKSGVNPINTNALIQSYLGGHEEIVSFLIECGNDPNDLSEVKKYIKNPFIEEYKQSKKRKLEYDDWY